MVCNREPDRQSVNRSGKALKHQDCERERFVTVIGVAVLAYGIDNHLDTYVQQQSQGYPGDEFLELGECLRYRMNAEPADQRHCELEDAVDRSYGAHSSSVHPGLVQTVGQRHREGVHSQPDAQQNAVYEKQVVQLLGGVSYADHQVDDELGIVLVVNCCKDIEFAGVDTLGGLDVDFEERVVSVDNDLDAFDHIFGGL